MFLQIDCSLAGFPTVTARGGKGGFLYSLFLLIFLRIGRRKTDPLGEIARIGAGFLNSRKADPLEGISRIDAGFPTSRKTDPLFSKNVSKSILLELLRLSYQSVIF